nr:MAG TPA: hypothetical protein [Bacteriophage sp.]DAX15198.1 MAG TPA: hypothetical protein [Bacteriophage sp.]
MLFTWTYQDYILIFICQVERRFTTQEVNFV